jgi:ATP-binding cassette, subfamily B, multidrug efflux pump
MTEDPKLQPNNVNLKQPKPLMPFGPGGAGRVGLGLAEKPKDFWATIKKLVSYMKPFRISIIFVFVFAITSTVFAILSPRILGNMTNQVVNDFVDMKSYDQIINNIPKTIKITADTTGVQLLQMLPQEITKQIPSSVLGRIKGLNLSVRPQINFDKLKNFVFKLLILYILSAIFSYIQGWIMTGASQKITYKLRRDISEKINRLPLAYFDKKTFGEVLSRVTNDVDTVSQTLNQSLTQIITSITMIIGILIMMLSISWQMTLVSLVLVPLSFVLMGFIIRKSQRYFKEQQDSLGEINGHIEEMYAGHNVMRVLTENRGQSKNSKESTQNFLAAPGSRNFCRA